MLQLCRLLVLALITAAIGTACSHTTSADPQNATDRLVEVWIAEGHPSEQMPAPAGFTVTPSGAYGIVRASKRLSLKHHWACYRDGSSYYIYDTFGRAVSARDARRHGVKINGMTGSIE